MSKKVNLIIKGDNINYQTEIDEYLAGRVISMCLNDYGNDKDINGGPIDRSAVKGQNPKVKKSPAEFINEYDPKSIPQKIAVLSKYLVRMHSKESFTPDEIKSLFRDANEKIPANYSRDFKLAISEGWVAEDPDKRGSYYLTSTGEKVLNEGFATPKRKKGRRARRIKK